MLILIHIVCRCCSWSCLWCCRKREAQSRTIWVGRQSLQQFPPNLIKNQKYNIFTFLPLLLWNQFKFFLNLFFLIMACSQFIPQLRIGYLYTYWGPLGFVLSVTIIREAIDDIRRWQRDRQVNRYEGMLALIVSYNNHNNYAARSTAS